MCSIHEAFLLRKIEYGSCWSYDKNYKKAFELLEAGADPNELNNQGFNLLHLIASYRRCRSEGEFLDYFEHMPKILEKALPLMKDRGINQKLKSKEEYKELEASGIINWCAGCTPLHLAISGMDGRGYGYYKTLKDDPRHEIRTMTLEEVEKKCEEYREMFLTKLLVYGADKTIKDENGWDAYQYVEKYIEKASYKNSVNRILDK
jgi:ankyrin repeat protein